MTHIIHITLAAFAFRFVRELEEEVTRGNMRNWSIMPNSNDGWTAKWKYPLQDYKPKWYHGFIKLPYYLPSITFKPFKFRLKHKTLNIKGIATNHKERFPFSSTLFVWLTDAEHFYQLVQTISIIVMVYAATQLPPLQAIAATLAGFAAAQIIKEIIKKIN